MDVTGSGAAGEAALAAAQAALVTQAALAAQASSAQAGQAEMAAALAGVWGALGGAADLNSLAALGIDLNTLAVLSQAAAAAGTQPALRQALGLPDVQPAVLALGNGLAGGKGPGKGGYKTRLCTYFSDMGTCPNGANCTFAHGAQEIHGWKTRMCKFAADPLGSCPQGDKCSFAHGIQEIQVRQEPGSMDTSSASAMNPAGTVSSQLTDLQAGLNFHNAFGALGIDMGVLSVLSQLLTSTQQPPAAAAHGFGTGQTN